MIFSTIVKVLKKKQFKSYTGEIYYVAVVVDVENEKLGRIYCKNDYDLEALPDEFEAQCKVYMNKKGQLATSFTPLR